MKILFFHRWVGVHHGGTETHLRSLAERFVANGHTVSILTREGLELRDIDKRINVYRVGKNIAESDHSYENVLLLYFHTSLFMFKSFLYLLYLYLIKGLKFDVVSVHFVTEAYVMRFFRLLFKMPYVFILEGYTPLEGAAARFANLAIAISKSEVLDVKKNHGYEPIYLPIGCKETFNTKLDSSETRKKYIDGASKLIICVGRIEPRKDHPTLLKTAKIVKEQGYNFRWLVVGEGIDSEKIKSLIIANGLESTVIMTGAPEDNDLPLFYRASDLFVLPTLYEGFGIVFVEAMSCGLPIVSTNVGAVPEVVGKAGVLVNPKDPAALATAIIKVLTNGSLYDELVSEAHKKSEEYLWSNLIPNYEKAYLGVIKTNG